MISSILPLGYISILVLHLSAHRVAIYYYIEVEHYRSLTSPLHRAIMRYEIKISQRREQCLVASTKS